VAPEAEVVGLAEAPEEAVAPEAEVVGLAEVEEAVEVEGQEAAGEAEVEEGEAAAVAGSSTPSRPGGGEPSRRGCSSAGSPALRPCCRSTRPTQEPCRRPSAMPSVKRPRQTPRAESCPRAH
jgi:hypothetical protein